MNANQTLIDKIEEVLVCYNGMSRSSVVTHAFAVCIFGANCTHLVNFCDDEKALAKAITGKMVSEAASVIIAQAKNYFAGRVEVHAFPAVFHELSKSTQAEALTAMRALPERGIE